MAISAPELSFYQSLPLLKKKERWDRVAAFTRQYFQERNDLSPSLKHLTQMRVKEIAEQVRKNCGLTDWPKSSKQAESYVAELKKVLVQAGNPIELPELSTASPMVQNIFKMILTDDPQVLTALKQGKLTKTLFGPGKKQLLDEVRQQFKLFMTELVAKCAELKSPEDHFWADALIGHLLAYYTFFDPPNGDQLSIPLQQDGQWMQKAYTLEKMYLTPAWMGTPVTAFGLKADNAPPLLLFKGTGYPSDDGFVLGILADVNPFASVGAYPFMMGKKLLHNWLVCEVAAAGNKKARVYGLSLGGALTERAAIEFPELIATANAYCPPAMLGYELARWNKQQAANPHLMPKVNVFVQENDIVPLAGTSRGKDWNVYRVLGKKPPFFLLAHIKSFIGMDNHLTLRDKSSRKSFYEHFIYILHLIVSLPLFLLGVIIHTLMQIAKKIAQLCKKIFRRK